MPDYTGNRELSDDELDNVTGGDSCDVGYSCPKCGKYGGFFQRALYGCTFAPVTCACCRATCWDPTSTKNTELIDFGWRDIF